MRSGDAWVFFLIYIIGHRVMIDCSLQIYFNAILYNVGV